MCFSVFAVVPSTVAFPLRLHLNAASSDDRYNVRNFFRKIHQWTRKFTRSRNEHRICSGPQNLLPVTLRCEAAWSVQQERVST